MDKLMLALLDKMGPDFYVMVKRKATRAPGRKEALYLVTLTWAGGRKSFSESATLAREVVEDPHSLVGWILDMHVKVVDRLRRELRYER